MRPSSFESIAEEIIVSMHNMDGLHEKQLNRFLLALQREKEKWAALDVIPKSKAHALIMSRESIMDSRNYYKDSKEVPVNFDKAESAINFLSKMPC